MKKIMLTTEQFEKVTNFVSNDNKKPQVINEELRDNEYVMECEIDFDFRFEELKYKGGIIDDINDTLTNVKFNIDMDVRSYGIKDMSVYNFIGEPTITTGGSIYSETDDDTHEEEIEISIDWENVEIEVESNKESSMIGIDRDIEISLVNNENGGIVANKIIITTLGI